MLLVSQPSKAEFVRLKEDQTQSCSLQLTEAKNIKHQCFITTDESSPLEFWKPRLSFHFGKISESDFISLKNIYSGWSRSQTAVSYDPNKSYQLIDFLPPLIQALNDHRFIPEEKILEQHEVDFFAELYPSQTEFKKYLYMNCWGLIYEVLRAAKQSSAKPMLFMGQGSLMLEQLRQNSELLLTLQEPIEFPIPGRLTKPGDIILVMHKSSAGYDYLDHIAIAIDDGIYFEKAGTGEHVPIRIIDETTLRKIWPPGVFYYELRRTHQNSIFPHPQEIFSLNSELIKEQLFRETQIPLNINKNISLTWDIESENLSAISWFYMLDISPLLRDQTRKARLTENFYQPLLIDE